MNTKLVITLCMASVLSLAQLAQADQVVGTETLAVSVNEDQLVAFGRSAEKEILHKPVYNDAGEKLGVIEDIIISPEKSVSYAVVDIGDFLGIPRHPVLVPFRQLKGQDDKFILSGATKAAMKTLPQFKYNKH